MWLRRAQERPPQGPRRARRRPQRSPWEHACSPLRSTGHRRCLTGPEAAGPTRAHPRAGGLGRPDVADTGRLAVESDAPRKGITCRPGFGSSSSSSLSWPYSATLAGDDCVDNCARRRLVSLVDLLDAQRARTGCGHVQPSGTSPEVARVKGASRRRRSNRRDANLSVRLMTTPAVEDPCATAEGGRTSRACVCYPWECSVGTVAVTARRLDFDGLTHRPRPPRRGVRSAA